MATRVWLGTAANITQRDTITAAGTWATGDTATVTINGNDLTVTVGSDVATTDIAQIISAAINATDRDDSIVNDETRNIGGQEIPEFTEVTASYSGSVVTVEADAAGVPFTMTVSENTAGTGTITRASAAAATGAYHFDNADNWSGTTVPVSSDTIIFQNNDVDCLYEISQTSLASILLQIDASYTGSIGLPSWNANGYAEYRDRHLAMNFSAAERSVVIGDGSGGGSSRINIDADSSDPKIVIVSTGAASASSLGAVDIIGGGAAMDISVRAGYVSFAADSRDSVAIDDLETDGSPRIIVGQTTTTLDGISMTGGTITLTNTPSSMTIGTVDMAAGTLTVNGKGACTTLNINGGTVNWNSNGTITTVNIGGTGTLDLSADQRSKAITNIERYSDASRVIDPNKAVTSLVIDNNNVGDTSNLTLGNDFKITRSATT